MRPGAARPRARRHSARARERAMPSEAYDNVVRGGLKLKTSALAVGKSVDKKAKKRHKREKKDKKEVRLSPTTSLDDDDANARLTTTRVCVSPFTETSRARRRRR